MMSRHEARLLVEGMGVAGDAWARYCRRAGRKRGRPLPFVVRHPVLTIAAAFVVFMVVYCVQRQIEMGRI